MSACRPDHHRYIEVIGIPGAGKTTLFERLAAAPSRQGARPLRALRPTDPGGRHAISCAARLAAQLLATTPAASIPLLARPDGRWLIGKLGYRLAALSRRRDLTAGALLLDSGVLQPLISFHAEFREARPVLLPLPQLLALLPAPAGLVYLQAAPELAFARYRQRQVDTGRRLDAVVLEEHFVEAGRACEQVAEACRRAGSRLVTLRADQTGDVAVIARIITTLAAEVCA